MALVFDRRNVWRGVVSRRGANKLRCKNLESGPSRIGDKIEIRVTAGDGTRKTGDSSGGGGSEGVGSCARVSEGEENDKRDGAPIEFTGNGRRATFFQLSSRYR